MESLRKQLFRSYWKAEAALVPGLTTSQHSYYLKLKSLLPGKIWLDMGCGHQVFAEWMMAEQKEVLGLCRRVYGIDLDWAGLRAHPGIPNKVFGNLEHLPFADESFDVVSANMVVEHLERPEIVLSEVRRCLVPGGKLIFHTPNYKGWATQLASRFPEILKKKLIWALERRKEEDVFQTYYRMNTSEQIRELSRQTGFGKVDIQLVSSSAVTASFGPLAIPELLYIRRLQHPEAAERRSNVIAVLEKV